MPYIPEKTRDKYDDRLEAIAFTLNSITDNDKLSGELNFVFYRLACTLCHEESGGSHNYARMAVVASALNEAQAEFRRRVMVPYEDDKIISAGDVEL